MPILRLSYDVNPSLSRFEPAHLDISLEQFLRDNAEDEETCEIARSLKPGEKQNLGFGDWDHIELLAQPKGTSLGLQLLLTETQGNRDKAYAALETAYPDFNPFDDEPIGQGSHEHSYWRGLCQQCEFLEGIIKDFDSLFVRSPQRLEQAS